MVKHILDKCELHNAKVDERICLMETYRQIDQLPPDFMHSENRFVSALNLEVINATGGFWDRFWMQLLLASERRYDFFQEDSSRRTRAGRSGCSSSTTRCWCVLISSSTSTRLRRAERHSYFSSPRSARDPAPHPSSIPARASVAGSQSASAGRPSRSTRWRGSPPCDTLHRSTDTSSHCDSCPRTSSKASAPSSTSAQKVGLLGRLSGGCASSRV
jgi:hypothetical protein